MNNKRASNINLLTIFILIIVAANAICTAVLWTNLKALEGQMNTRVGLVEAELDSPNGSVAQSSEFIDYYRDINAKMDQSIDRIITVVEITVTTILVFGFLLAYRAPRDVERELDRLRSETENAKESASEARYQALIGMAANEKSAHNRIERLSDLITRYPEKPSAYVARGVAYSEMHEYDRAIRDYEDAFTRGQDEGAYLNNVAVAHSRAGHYEIAEELYERAMVIRPNDTSLYSNRANMRGIRKDYDGALADYEIALSLDSRDCSVYVNRAMLYRHMMSGTTGADLQGLSNKSMNDLLAARKLEPENPRVAKLFEQAVERMQSYESNKSDVQQAMAHIARIEAELAENALGQNEDLEAAIEHFERATEAIAFARFGHEDDCANEGIIEWLSKQLVVERMIEAITSRVILCGEIDLDLGPIASDLIIKAGYDAYLGGDTLCAERLFSFVAHSRGSRVNVALINLAYMRRRDESRETREAAVDLLDLCTGLRSGVWTMNMALCYVDGVGVEVDKMRFVNLLKADSEGAKESFDWWSNEKVVGPKESNIALLGLAIAGFQELGDGTPLALRVARAEKDGYDLSGVVLDEDLNNS